MRFAVPRAIARYLVEKGSVTVDGVSLTVVEVGTDYFTVGLLPTTLGHSMLGRHQPGAAVNLEVDIAAKYVEKLVAQAVAQSEAAAIARLQRCWEVERSLKSGGAADAEMAVLVAELCNA